MRCEHALPLIPRYVDGELAEPEAASLRQHLLGCQACRVRVQESGALKSWFVDPEPLVGPAEAPTGFAAQVSAMAFGAVEAGTPASQLADRVLRPALAGSSGATGPRPLAMVHAQAAKEDQQRLSGFVLNLVSAAAIVLLFLAFGLERRSLPEVDKLRADGTSMVDSLQALEALNEQERLQLEAERAAAEAGSPAAESSEATDQR